MLKGFMSKPYILEIPILIDFPAEVTQEANDGVQETTQVQGILTYNLNTRQMDFFVPMQEGMKDFIRYTSQPSEPPTLDSINDYLQSAINWAKEQPQGNPINSKFLEWLESLQPHRPPQKDKE